MAQHDQVIDNGPGLAVRTDINAALAALFSSNSGPVAPGTTVAGQVWFDTATPTQARLWLRDGANATWMPMFTASTVDVGFGKRDTPDRFVWNDRADLSGTDIMTLDDTGALTVANNILMTGTSASLKFSAADLSLLPRQAGSPAGSLDRLVLNNAADGNGVDTFRILDTGSIVMANGPISFNMMQETAGWRAINAGFSHNINFTPATGVLAFVRSSAAAAAGAIHTGFTQSFSMDANNWLTLGGGINEAPSGLFVHGRGTNHVFGLSGVASSTKQLNFDANSILQYNGASGDLFWLRISTAFLQMRASDLAFIMNGNQAYKPGGGPWAATSDARIKTDIAAYESGLDAILELEPVTYRYKGNDVPPADSGEYGGHNDTETSYIGLVAQQVEDAMPEMVTQQSGYIDGAKVEDLRIMDTGPLVFALINAVKTLAARVEALEAKG